MTVRMVLNQLFWEWGGYEWTSHLRYPGREWRKPTHYCTWYGLSCTDSGELASMHLPANNLQGTIPPALGELKSLVELDLGFNENLVGTLPATIGNLTKLTFLSMSFCGLTGFPPDLSRLVNLNYIDFRYNSMFYVPVDIKDRTHEILPQAKAWNELHKQGKLTRLSGFDPYCYADPPWTVTKQLANKCVGTSKALGTYWSQSQIDYQQISWTKRGRHSTSAQYTPPAHLNAGGKSTQPYFLRANSIPQLLGDPDFDDAKLINVVPVSMG